MTHATQTKRSFTPELFGFLRELRENNDREWFKANKERYEESVQEPALEFVADFAPLLETLSPHFVADPRPVGGSLFRIYRDTRFSKDKSPYKTHAGISFRHELARDVHAPVFYLHLDADRVFAGAGIWHPESTTLAQIRDAIVREPERWQEVVRDGAVGEGFRLSGDSLKRPPAGFDAAHPLIDDLKRKDYIATTTLSERTVTSARFPEKLAAAWATTTPFMRFLCDAIGTPF